MGESIIYRLTIKQEKTPEDFADLLIENLSNISPKTLRKRIISCCIELIQNNLKHNHDIANLSISESQTSFIVVISEKNNYDAIELLQTKIEHINKTSICNLRENFTKNLEKETKNTGNGLISCRLKSSNIIKFEYKKVDEDNLSIISLKFNKP